MSLVRSASLYQNPSYSSGAGLTSRPIVSQSGLSAENIYNTNFLDNRDRYEQTRNGYQMASSAREAAVNGKIKNIVSHIQNGRADKAMNSYNELLEQMAQQERFSHLKTENDDTQLRAVARDLIESRTNLDLEDLIRTNTSGKFENGFSFDLDNWSYSREDLLKEMCDLDEKTLMTPLKGVAGGLCKAALCAAAGAAVVALAPISLTVASGALAGAAIGLVGSLIL